MPLFKSNRLTVSAVRRHLKDAGGPALLDRIESLRVNEGDITLVLQVPETGASDTSAIEDMLSGLKGVNRVRVIETAHSAQPDFAPPARSDVKRVRKGANLSASVQAQAMPSAGEGTLNGPGVTHLIAVASAKGGVGKSTVAINLAVALRKTGLRVGVLDADVYGPSLPTMTGTVSADPEFTESKKLVPIEAFGLKLMSIGYVSDVDAPMIWRGPIVMSAITQMLKDVDWGQLDVLILDTPPGTGDAQLTLAQRVKLSGAVIVSTPQEVALADVRRGVAMFGKTGVPVLGIIENMAWFEDPGTSARTYIFGEGGARRMSETLEVPFLGEVPIMSGLREGGDTGEPAANAETGAIAETFSGLAHSVLEQLESLNPKPAPSILFE